MTLSNLISTLSSTFLLPIVWMNKYWVSWVRVGDDLQKSLGWCQDPTDYSKVSRLSTLGDIFVELKLMEQKQMESEMDRE